MKIEMGVKPPLKRKKKEWGKATEAYAAVRYAAVGDWVSITIDDGETARRLQINLLGAVRFDRFGEGVKLETQRENNSDGTISLFVRKVLK